MTPKVDLADEARGRPGVGFEEVLQGQEYQVSDQVACHPCSRWKLHASDIPGLESRSAIVGGKRRPQIFRYWGVYLLILSGEELQAPNGHTWLWGLAWEIQGQREDKPLCEGIEKT